MEWIDGFFTAYLMFVRTYWLEIFLGWWAIFAIGALRHRTKWADWLFLPALFTGVAVIVVTIWMTPTAYSAVEPGNNWSSQCYYEHDTADCAVDEQRAQSDYAVLVGDNIFATWINCFADAVAWVQCLWFWTSPFWLVIGLLMFLGRNAPLPEEKGKIERDIINV